MDAKLNRQRYVCGKMTNEYRQKLLLTSVTAIGPVVNKDGSMMLRTVNLHDGKMSTVSIRLEDAEKAIGGVDEAEYQKYVAAVSK